MRSADRISGIDIIGNIPWGTHFCQFYKTKEDLMDILIPYFKAGLENNEFCLWIISEQLDEEEAKKALKVTIPEIDAYLQSGQIEIVPHTCWHIEEGALDPQVKLNYLIEKAGKALASGYDGLRYSGNHFCDHEKILDSVIGKYPIMALCTYPIDKCSSIDIIEIASNHRFSLVKKEGKLELIENSGKKNSNNCRESEDSYRKIFENSLDGIFITIPDGTVLAANPAACQMFGMTEEEIIRAGRNGTVDASDPRLKYFLEERARTGRFRGELNHRRKDGTIFPSEISSTLFKDKNGITKGVMIIRDITERRQVEEAFRKSEELLRFALEISHTGVWDLDLVDHTAYRSLEHDRIFGYEQLLPQWTYEMFLDHVLPEDRWIVDAKFREAVAKCNDWNFKCRIRRIDGEIRWIWAAGRHRVDATGNKRIAGIVQDITERKKAEEALRESEKRFRALVMASSEMVYRVSPDWSEMRYFYGRGFLANTESPNPTWLNEYVLPEDQPRVTAIINEAIRTKSTYQTEHQVRLADGSMGWIFSRAVPLLDANGEIVEWFGAASDITKRKEAEAKLKDTLNNLDKLVKERTAELQMAYDSLKKSERNLAEAQEMAHIGSWERDISSNEYSWSDEIYRIFGLKPQESKVNYNFFLNYVHPDDRNYVDNANKETLKGKPLDINFRIIRNNGEERTVHAKAELVFNEKNNPVRIRGTTQDITEHKKAEERIQSLANVVESSTEAIITESFEGIIKSWNKGAEQVYGYSAKEVLGKSISILELPVLAGDIQRLSEMIKRGEKVQQYETLRLRKDGKVINVSLTIFPVLDNQGKITAASVIATDITRRKEAEEKLRESEEKYRNIVETANELILTTDNENVITYVNKRMEDMLGYNMEEFIGRPIWSFISEECKPIVKMNLENRRRGISGSYELKLIRKDGSSLWTFLNAKPLFDREGKYVGAMSMLTDITERKKAEETLTNIETARKKEIHHRIKNNLQVISSLLDLQAEKFNNRECVPDSEVLEAFRESRDRVISMALIHEELYKGEGFEALNFSLYIEELARTLFQTYRLGNTDISLSMDLEENLFFDMDTAVPLGMIVNELISNSLKHAFPDREKGEIRITLHRVESTELENEDRESTSTNFTLTISDNGVGIPENLDVKDLDSLGMQLVTSLVDQLDGELELKRDNGTEFTIRFTVTGKNE